LGKPASVDGVGLGAFSAGADIGFHLGGIGAVGRFRGNDEKRASKRG
jgi:hypothetical protein